jgi:hypothetical protein
MATLTNGNAGDAAGEREFSSVGDLVAGEREFK